MPDLNLRLVASGTPSDPQDEDVPGTYGFTVPADYPAAWRASAVLDTFHSSVAVDVLDDFDFVVIDEDGNTLFEPDDAEAYDRKDHAEFHGKLEVPEPTPR